MEANLDERMADKLIQQTATMVRRCVSFAVRIGVSGCACQNRAPGRDTSYRPPRFLLFLSPQTSSACFHPRDSTRLTHPSTVSQAEESMAMERAAAHLSNHLPPVNLDDPEPSSSHSAPSDALPAHAPSPAGGDPRAQEGKGGAGRGGEGERGVEGEERGVRLAHARASWNPPGMGVEGA